MDLTLLHYMAFIAILHKLMQLVTYVIQHPEAIQNIALITGGGIALWKYSHTKKLEYTQNERKEWRNKLRSCLEKMMEYKSRGCDNVDLRTLSVVKSCLNPNPGDNTLDKLVSEQFEEQNNLKYQILALQFLLKFDWERAKKANNLSFSAKNELDLSNDYKDQLNEKINSTSNRDANPPASN